MQFESKITPNVIAKDEVLKQSQNQIQSRFGNFKKRLRSLSQAIKSRLLRLSLAMTSEGPVRNDKPAYAYPYTDRQGTLPAMTSRSFFSQRREGPVRNDKIGIFQSPQIRNDKGFTFLQVLIVVGIIAVLAGIAIVRFNSALTKAKVDKAKVEIEMMGRAIEQIEEDTENYIEGLDQLDDTTAPVPDDLDTSFSPWWGPYLSSLPKNIRDPWGTSYAYFFWTTDKERGKQFRMGNYPPGPKGWVWGKKVGWEDESLPPGLWKKLGPEEGLSGRGFLVVSAGPDREIATNDDIEYGKY